jgi:hypothetical protein
VPPLPPAEAPPAPAEAPPAPAEAPPAPAEAPPAPAEAAPAPAEAAPAPAEAAPTPAAAAVAPAAPLEPKALADMSAREIRAALLLAQAERAAVRDKLEKHLGRDIEVRRWLHEIIDVGKLLHNVRVLEAKWAGCTESTFPRAFCSQPNMTIVHGDDAAAKQLPQVVHKSREEMQKHNIGVIGFYNLIKNAVHLLLTEAGIKKTASGVLEEIVMYILRTIQGEQFIGFIFDCGPLNHCALITAALLMLLVDLGVVEFAVAAFFWQNVSVCPFPAPFPPSPHRAGGTDNSPSRRPARV